MLSLTPDEWIAVELSLRIAFVGALGGFEGGFGLGLRHGGRRALTDPRSGSYARAARSQAASHTPCYTAAPR